MLGSNYRGQTGFFYWLTRLIPGWHSNSEAEFLMHGINHETTYGSVDDNNSIINIESSVSNQTSSVTIVKALNGTVNNIQQKAFQSSESATSAKRKITPGKVTYYGVQGFGIVTSGIGGSVPYIDASIDFAHDITGAAWHLFEKVKPTPATLNYVSAVLFLYGGCGTNFFLTLYSIFIYVRKFYEYLNRTDEEAYVTNSYKTTALERLAHLKKWLPIIVASFAGGLVFAYLAIYGDNPENPKKPAFIDWANGVFALLATTFGNILGLDSLWQVIADLADKVKKEMHSRSGTLAQKTDDEVLKEIRDCLTSYAEQTWQNILQKEKDYQVAVANSLQNEFQQGGYEFLEKMFNIMNSNNPEYELVPERERSKLRIGLQILATGINISALIGYGRLIYIAAHTFMRNDIAAIPFAIAGIAALVGQTAKAAWNTLDDIGEKHKTSLDVAFKLGWRVLFTNILPISMALFSGGTGAIANIEFVNLYLAGSLLALYYFAITGYAGAAIINNYFVTLMFKEILPQLSSGHDNKLIVNIDAAVNKFLEICKNMPANKVHELLISNDLPEEAAEQMVNVLLKNKKKPEDLMRVSKNGHNSMFYRKMLAESSKEEASKALPPANSKEPPRQQQKSRCLIQ